MSLPRLKLVPIGGRNRTAFAVALLTAALLATEPASAQSDNWNYAEDPRPEPSGLWEGIPAAVKQRGRWAFEFGWGVIGDTVPADYYTGEFDRFEGRGEGYTYNFTLSYQLQEFDWRAFGCRLQPALELPFMLTLVDQNVGGVVPDANLGLLFRWRDFPWNRWLYTTAGVCGGLSYAFDNWEADVSRHPGEDRSQLKFWGSLEFTLALPAHPHHQAVLFIDHQSGGHLFDQGGIDAWGIGYRYLF
jgi:hypothetical protein